MHRNVSVFLPCSLVLLLAGCSLYSSEPDEAARIIAGRSIEGIVVGDDSAAVVHRLGAPASVLTDAYGQTTLRYTQGEHAGLDVVLARDSSGSRVHRVSVRAPYEGRSKEGVGVGTERDQVLDAWSEPERANDLDSLRYDLYFYDSVFVGVETRGGAVTQIDMEGLVEDPRIVWGESIEGVRLGDDSLSVIQRLGEPSSVGAEDYFFTSMYYFEGRLRETDVYLWKGQVFNIRLIPPYKGQTQTGVGIGMSREDVLKRLGAPDRSPAFYDFGQSFWEVDYVDGIVSTIFVGLTDANKRR